MPPRTDFASTIAHARTRNQPLLAFNVVDPTSLYAVADAGIEVGQPIIAQVSPRTVEFYGADTWRALVDNRPLSDRGDVFLHLDHCSGDAILQAAIDARFDGIMVDFSASDFDANVASTTHWATKAHAAGMIIESELGAIPGAEDGAAEGGDDERPSAARCLEFQQLTQTDLFGTEIGTAHGIYTSAPAIDFDLISDLAPGRAGFVIHGGSGVPADDLQRLASLGVAKINFSTDLKLAWAAGLRPEITSGAVPEPIRALKSARKQITEMAIERFASLRKGLTLA